MATPALSSFGKEIKYLFNYFVFMIPWQPGKQENEVSKYLMLLNVKNTVRWYFLTFNKHLI